MKSVADSLRVDAFRETSQLSASERVSLALALGDRAVETFAAANDIDAESARRTLRRNNQLGRRLSASAGGDGG